MSSTKAGVVLIVIAFCLAALALVNIWKLRAAPDQPQITANAAAAAPTAPPPPAAPVQVAAQAVNCEKYVGLMHKCVSDFQSVRAALDAANAISVPPSEERDFEALSAANDVAMVGTCVESLMRQIAHDTPGAPDPTFDLVMPYMQCPSTRLMMENDAHILEQWHVVVTRAAEERCGSAILCEVCKRSRGTSKTCIGIAAPDTRLTIRKKGSAFRTILSATRR